MWVKGRCGRSLRGDEGWRKWGTNDANLLNWSEGVLNLGEMMHGEWELDDGLGLNRGELYGDVKLGGVIKEENKYGG